jgi:hypothetical protein
MRVLNLQVKLRSSLLDGGRGTSHGGHGGEGEDSEGMRGRVRTS